MKSRLYHLWRYVAELLFLIGWGIMMVYPEKAGTYLPEAFLSGGFFCGILYSFCRRHYAPDVRPAKVEKILVVVLVTALAIRLSLA
ncbi:MAG TPA: hypothetical protein IAB74_03510 [Candidatus Faecousia excrementigallinarum]|uniref:Uncharacterized protein n=1 Tax=Candidatus Faecousia excrementigallinarum TaxID=2840806 RepID=A0A9D1CM12_9FIRM|nr:hypothetical protein [Candidatus Faecousia excrementigallinarum]